VGELDFLREVIRRHAHNEHTATPIDGLMITATDHPTEPRAGIAERSLAIVAQGAKRTVVGDGVFDYRAGDFLVVSLDLPVIGQVTTATPATPFLGLGVRLDPTEIAALLVESATLGVPAGSSTATPGRTPAIAVARAGDDLLDACGRLAGLLDAPRDAPILAPLHRREILWRLLNGPHGPLIRQIGLADGNLAHIARTVSWIRRNYRDTVRVDELAALAGMSSSVFYRHFRLVTQLTPIQYQKAIRLQEARLLLIAGRGDVAEISHLVGYDSTSQFSREYRRRFGSPPGRDGARLRAAA
jgi:AraC-like DNA-binding protein